MFSTQNNQNFIIASDIFNTGFALNPDVNGLEVIKLVMYLLKLIRLISFFVC